MSTENAWRHILNNWMTPIWQPLPDEVKQALKLASNIGLYSGMLVTKTGSNGMIEFIRKMNSIRA